MVGNLIRFFIIEFEKFDLGQNWDIVESPIKEIAGPWKQLKQVGETFLFVEKYKRHSFILVDTFKKPEDSSGIFSSFLT